MLTNMAVAPLGLGFGLMLCCFAGACAGPGGREDGAWDPEDTGESSGGVAGSTTDVLPAETTGTPPAPDSSQGEEPPPPPTPDVPQDACPRVRITVMPGNVLNVRDQPATSGAEVGELGPNTIVDVLDSTHGESVEGTDLWFEISFGQVQGWITGAYAECTFDEPPELQPPAGFHLPIECGVTTTIAQGNGGAFSHSGAAYFAFDFSVGLNTPLVAMADGIVIHTFAETMPGDPCYDGGDAGCFAFGNLVVLLHGDGSTSLYKHLNAVWTLDGEFVPQGTPVGLSGSTGYSTGPHAHVMRMEDCGMAQCESIPLEFLEAGVPEQGDSVTSENCPA
jgi:murein DD-endopeptidase MepM/ murein hydrolase activator NlpD